MAVNARRNTTFAPVAQKITLTALETPAALAVPRGARSVDDESRTKIERAVPARGCFLGGITLATIPKHNCAPNDGKRAH